MSRLDLLDFARNVYSQNGEDGVLEKILELIGTTNKYCVEFGGGNGKHLSNTRHLLDQGWDGVMFDAKPPKGNPLVIEQKITVANVNKAFKKNGVPKEFDLLSIDIDGNDYWVFKALKYRARVVLIEFNGHLPPAPAVTIPYKPNFKIDRQYYGASQSALVKLAAAKGYTLVCQLGGINLLFCADEVVPKGVEFVVRAYDRQKGDTSGKWVSV